MNTGYLAILFALIGTMALLAGPEAVAQQKYTISQPANATSKFTQEHIIEVGDVPGHKLRSMKFKMSTRRTTSLSQG